MAATAEPSGERVETQLNALPGKPGVYLFRDGRDDVLYVGKAKSLRSRVRSYFRGGDARPGLERMVERVERIEVIVTQSEGEALHLEQNLIKRHRPPFNVRLRDDKSYPYIAVTVGDDFPRVMFTRERHRRGVVYFGPYSSAKKVRETLDVLNRVFPYRPCEGPQPGRHSGVPCLDYHIERCLAPCVGYVSKEEYRDDHRRRRSSSCRATREPIQRELEAADAGRGRAAGIRGGGTLPQPPVRDPPPRRAAGGRPPRPRHGRRDRARRARATSPPCRCSRSATAGLSTGTASRSRTSRARTRRRSSRPSASSSTASAPACRRSSSSRRGSATPRRSPSSCRRGAGRASRCARRSAVRSGALQELAQRERRARARQRGARAPSASALRRIEALEELREALNLESLPIRIECFDISNIQDESPVGVDGRVRGRGREEGPLPQVRDPASPADRTTSR